MASKNGEQKALAKVEHAYPALGGGSAAVQAAMKANLGGEKLTQFDLDRVKVPSSGATTWEIPQMDGEPLSVRGLDGIIVFSKMVRSYWKKNIDEGGGNSPPDCSSPDMIHGIGDPGVLCEECPFSQWGSDRDKQGNPTRGQACKQMRALFILREGAALPLVLMVPPSSLKTMKKFLVGLTMKGLPYYHLIVRLALAKVKNANGIEYSEIRPTVLRTLEPDEIERVEPYAQQTALAFSGYHEGVGEEIDDDDDDEPEGPNFGDHEPEGARA